jgi:hypothetical protein
MSITVTPRSIAVLATAIDFYLPHGWSDDLGQKVVDAAAVRMGNVEQLRDRFAMAALQGDLASEGEEFRTIDDPSKDGVWVIEGRTKTREQKLAENAYLVADAMLAARSAKAAP